MIFSDTEMMELGIRHTTNIHNTRSLIRTLKYVLDILQTEEAFTVEEYKHTYTRARARTHTHTHMSPSNERPTYVQPLLELLKIYNKSAPILTFCAI